MIFSIFKCILPRSYGHGGTDWQSLMLRGHLQNATFAVCLELYDRVVHAEVMHKMLPPQCLCDASCGVRC